MYSSDRAGIGTEITKLSGPAGWNCFRSRWRTAEFFVYRFSECFSNSHFDFLKYASLHLRVQLEPVLIKDNCGIQAKISSQWTGKKYGPDRSGLTTGSVRCGQTGFNSERNAQTQLCDKYKMVSGMNDMSEWRPEGAPTNDSEMIVELYERESLLQKF
jgi:hypothetical protein